MPLTGARRIPLSTYRVQFHAGFTFADAQALVPYFEELGISDLYCSPILLSSPGSMHGYDVSDYRKISPQIGGGEGFVRLSEDLLARGMGVLLDFVPNHMGINGPFNAWWRDVLESGKGSPYARFFDILWNTRWTMEDDRVLVAILDDHFGSVLERGGFELRYCDGALSVIYGDNDFPLSPATYGRVLTPVADDPELTAEAADALRAVIARFSRLRRPDAREQPDRSVARDRRIHGLKRELHALVAAHSRLREAIERRVRKLNGVADDPRSYDELGEMLNAQNYRLARWTAGTHETNYRRFFAVNSLIGLRMEKPEVFADTHMMIADLISHGRIQGLRIDHIDGLWDPAEYLERLQALARARREDEDDQNPFYVVVEKILAEGEHLPAEWQAHGTTGYEFINQLANLLVNPASDRQLTELYARFTGETERFGEVVYVRKRLMLEEIFANAVTNLAAELAMLVNQDRHWCDLTRQELTIAVREIMAGLNVYRTYRRPGRDISDQDRNEIEQACARALLRNRHLDSEPFEFVRDLLIGKYPPADAAVDYRNQALDWALTFQQYTGAIMAKSVEDTAFYVYNRFIALNEVGGHPVAFGGGGVAAFHEANAARRERAPCSLLATSTHDTKLSEDVRARLYALSEIPEEWEGWVAEWSDVNRRHKLTIDGRPAPDANEEYRIYQELLGAWPFDLVEPNEEFRRRFREHLRKAVSEARCNTTWLHPNEPWLQACDRFLDAILTPSSGRDFLHRFAPRAARLAHLGMINSLAQIVLKCTCPGVPDFYQGNEIWDFSLVDPDNRRPVDYAPRRRLAAEAARRRPRELLRHWRDGGIKLRTTQALLGFRREHPRVFQEGDYQPLTIRGRFSAHAIAFRRASFEDEIAVVVPRLTAKIGCPPLGLVWEDTAVAMPVSDADPPWSDVITGDEVVAAAELPLADLLDELPFAVLARKRSRPA